MLSFKPCYKWNAFNTASEIARVYLAVCFKPCYKWNTFNTDWRYGFRNGEKFCVLNLIITGIPSIPRLELACKNNEQEMF